MIRTLKYWFVILFNLFVITACNNETSPQLEKKVAPASSSDETVWKIGLDTFLKKYKISIVLTKIGCKSCNDELVLIIEKYFKGGERRFGVVVETTGSHYNISALLNEDYKSNVFHDFRGQLTKKYELKNSCLLFYSEDLEKENVEIFEVKSASLDQVEAKITEHLNKLKEESNN